MNVLRKVVISCLALLGADQNWFQTESGRLANERSE
jgi:hypothetical protein